MDKEQAIKHIKEGRLWFTENEEGQTVWGVGDTVLPVNIEFAEPVNKLETL